MNPFPIHLETPKHICLCCLSLLRISSHSDSLQLILCSSSNSSLPISLPPSPPQSLPWYSNLLLLCLTSEFNPQISYLELGSHLSVLFDALEGLHNYMYYGFDNNGSILMGLTITKYIKLLNTVADLNKVKSYYLPTLWYLRLPLLPLNSWVIFLWSHIDRSTQTVWNNNS